MSEHWRVRPSNGHDNISFDVDPSHAHPDSSELWETTQRVHKIMNLLKVHRFGRDMEYFFMWQLCFQWDYEDRFLWFIYLRIDDTEMCETSIKIFILLIL